MKPNPILEEIWHIKDELAREAGYDLHRMCENTRKWAAAHPRPGRVVHSAQDLRELAEEEEPKRAEAGGLALKEEPPREDTRPTES
jgi:hypothetical protein